MLFVSSVDFFKNQLFQKILSLRNTIRVSNSFDRDQDRRSGSKLFAKVISAEMTKLASSKEELNTMYDVRARKLG